jgi:hypothetical protein
MDDQTFDTVPRLFSTAGSHRTAWRALLGLGLSGAAMGVSERVRAAPKRRPGQICEDGRVRNGDACCGGECCLGRCFVGDEEEFCCTQLHTPPRRGLREPKTGGQSPQAGLLPRGRPRGGALRLCRRWIDRRQLPPPLSGSRRLHRAADRSRRPTAPHSITVSASTRSRRP